MRQNGCDMIDVVRGEGSSGADRCRSCSSFVLVLDYFSPRLNWTRDSRTRTRTSTNYPRPGTFIHYLICIPLLLFFSGCSKPVANTSSAPATNRWSWESYPVVEKMRLGILPCRVLPK